MGGPRARLGLGVGGEHTAIFTSLIVPIHSAHTLN